METLITFALVIMFYCLTVMGTIFVIGLIGFAISGYLDYQKKRWIPWQKLASANNLTFVPGQIFEGPQVVGNYGRHFLKLKTVPRGGNNNQTYTRIIISVNSSVEDHLSLTNGGVLAKPLTVDDVTSLFAPDLEYNLWEKVKATSTGQIIFYEKLGVETNPEYLQYLFNWLSDLADDYPAIVALGGAVAPSLHTIAKRSSLLQPIATQLLRDIAQETTTRLGNQSSQLLCLYCLTRCDAHKVWPSWWESTTYYGCRVCGQSREFLRGSITVAVLDNGTTAEASQQRGMLRVNWLTRRALFDFDAVEILQATDEDVERFAMQIGNDTDPQRRPRYKQMLCFVSQDCVLSENTMRILRRIFGQIKVRQPVTKPVYAQTSEPSQVWLRK